jgi:hypothetical protein
MATGTEGTQHLGATAVEADRLVRPYGVGRSLHGLPAGLNGRTLLAGVCLAGERLRLTPRVEEVRPCPER